MVEPADANPPQTLLARLVAMAGGRVVLGFDLPLGLPARYAALRGIAGFKAFLASLRPDDEFFAPATAASLGLERPFYPARPGGTSRTFQAQRLGVASQRELWRRCDHPTAVRPGACCMFWTLGPQQCGKAALACWRDVVLPALHAEQPPAIWPFDGDLEMLSSAAPITLVETYPAECYGHLGLARFAKSRQAARAAQAGPLIALARELAAVVAPSLAELCAAGFPDEAGGEHLFDALVGCLALLNILQGRRPEGAPDDPTVRLIEGWILGLDATTLRR